MKSLKILIITVIVVILDQITKSLIHNSMRLYESFKVLGDFFRITYVENTGMAFGIQVANSGFFTVFAVIASIAIMVYLFRMKGEHFIARFSMALILGGAIGNLWDRIIRGSVVDFLDFDFFNINIPTFKFLFIDFPGYSMDRWPVFNVADMGITIGMALLFIFILFEKEEEEMTNAGEAEIIR
jgi:signal peptidase II